MVADLRSEFPEPLRCTTPKTWAQVAAADFDATVIDHAHCEKKAASQALSLIAQYGSDHPWLIDPLIGLAQEELRHFRQVHRIIRQRGLTLTRDPGDPYVKALLGLARHSEPERFVDRMLISAMVEARSAERLALLAETLSDTSLKQFYSRLARSEAGHYVLYLRLARKGAKDDRWQARLESFAEAEAQIVTHHPIAARIH